MAWVRFNTIAASASQAEFAANWPEGRWARWEFSGQR